MPMCDFKIQGKLGEGSFAAVTKVTRISDGKTYALKRVNISKMKQQEIADTLNEIRFLSSVRHPYIVGFLEAFLDRGDSELCIVMEYCAFGDLAEKIERYKKRRQYIDEKVIWAYLIQALEALTHLHSKRICHRDLKPANCFLCSDGTIKIGDMNVSKRLKPNKLLKTQIGTPYYMSPEIWSNKSYDEKSDIWALGCLVYELSALHPPFLGDSFPMLKKAVLNGSYKSLPKCYSSQLSSVIGCMLRTSSKSRPSASQLLNTTEVQKYQKPGGYGSVPPDSNKAINLMATIVVPSGGKKWISKVLPGACYPDVRPGSPEVWPVSARNREGAIEAIRNRNNNADVGSAGNGLESVVEDVVLSQVGGQSSPIKHVNEVVPTARKEVASSSRQQQSSSSSVASSQGQPSQVIRSALTPLSENNTNINTNISNSSNNERRQQPSGKPPRPITKAKIASNPPLTSRSSASSENNNNENNHNHNSNNHVNSNIHQRQYGARPQANGSRHVAADRAGVNMKPHRPPPSSSTASTAQSSAQQASGLPPRTRPGRPQLRHNGNGGKPMSKDAVNAGAGAGVGGGYRQANAAYGNHHQHGSIYGGGGGQGGYGKGQFSYKPSWWG